MNKFYMFFFAARMLVPYGLGSLSSMMNFRQLGQQVVALMIDYHDYTSHPSLFVILLKQQLGGIPLAIYQAMKARVGFTKHAAIRIPLVATTTAGDSATASNLAKEVSMAVYAASQSVHSHQESVTSMAGRVRLDNSSSRQLQQVNLKFLLTNAPPCFVDAANCFPLTYELFHQIQHVMYVIYFNRGMRPWLGACRRGGVLRLWSVYQCLFAQYRPPLTLWQSTYCGLVTQKYYPLTVL